MCVKHIGHRRRCCRETFPRVSRCVTIAIPIFTEEKKKKRGNNVRTQTQQHIGIRNNFTEENNKVDVWPWLYFCCFSYCCSFASSVGRSVSIFADGLFVHRYTSAFDIRDRLMNFIAPFSIVISNETNLSHTESIQKVTVNTPAAHKYIWQNISKIHINRKRVKIYKSFNVMNVIATAAMTLWPKQNRTKSEQKKMIQVPLVCAFGATYVRCLMFCRHCVVIVEDSMFRVVFFIDLFNFCCVLGILYLFIYIYIMLLRIESQQPYNGNCNNSSGMFFS